MRAFRCGKSQLREMSQLRMSGMVKSRNVFLGMNVAKRNRDGTLGRERVGKWRASRTRGRDSSTGPTPSHWAYLIGLTVAGAAAAASGAGTLVPVAAFF